MTYILAYDIGTTGVKTCLFGVEDSFNLLRYASRSYPLYILENGGAEQDENDWWQGMCECTREIFADYPVQPDQIAGISFCSQMQGLVLADQDGNPVRRPMNYLDQRAKAEIKKGIAHGLQIAGANIFKLIPSLIITGAVTACVKDPVWKYKWVEANEPEKFARAHYWLDVKEYLIGRCTGKYATTADDAFAALIYDTRPGHEGWSEKLCRMFGIKMELLPPIIHSTDLVGGLTEKAAAELGLKAGTPVFGGGGDTSLICVGSGAVRPGDTHIYCGTSGWVITVTEKQVVDTSAMIAASVGAEHGKFTYFAELETAGKCLEWAKEHLAQDELGIYGDQVIDGNVYNYLMEEAGKVPAGSGGVIFTPWLHGNRCPFEAADAAGMFFNVRLDTGKAALIRAVQEGVCYHMNWMLECQSKKVKISNPIRFIGGGALSPVTCQILADITGRTIETVDSPQNAGSLGAAAVVAVGLGIIPDLDGVKKYIPAAHTYVPDPQTHKAYQKYYQTFKKLYKTNKKLFRELNG